MLTQQQPGGEYRPVAYISRATEQRYAQIEKEALALTWACERLYEYLVGLHFHMVTDHKPLVPILSTKSLESLPLRFRLRLMRFSFTISHVPGKDLTIADALSRAPYSAPTESDKQFQQQVEAFVEQIIEALPATEQRLAQIQKKQEVCKKLAEFCDSGWPTKTKCPSILKPYMTISSELSVKDGLLMRIVIPAELQQDILHRLHEGHQGITKCRLQTVWWLNLSNKIEQLIQKCPVCCKERVQRMEPLKPTELPKYPWNQVGMDLFQWESRMYLLVVDYFSRYIEIAKLNNESAAEVIRHTKSIFARHGISQ